MSRTSPQGIRVVTLNNIQLFRSHSIGLYLSNVIQWTLINVGVYAGQGSGNDIYITGGGTASTNSTNTTTLGLLASGNLITTNSINTKNY